MMQQLMVVRIFKLLRRICIHKFWVAYYCFQIRLYWQGLTHDWSKFSLVEFTRAIHYWNDNKSSLAYEREINGYSETFLHHRGRNPHHYEYWIHSLDQGGIPAKMPLKYTQELICDYLGACHTYGGNIKDEFDWFQKIAFNIKMHPETRDYIRNVLYGIKVGMSFKSSIQECNKYY